MTSSKTILSQKTSQHWIALLPTAVLHIRNTPIKCGLSPFEMLYGRPFLTNDLLIDRETIELTQHITSLAQFQQAIQQLSKAQSRAGQKPLFNSGDEVLIKSLPSLSSTLDPVWKRPYTVILSSLTTIKVPESDSWIHHS